MAETNLERFERAAEAWNRGDWDAAFAWYDDEVVFEDELLPDGGVYRGLEAVRRRFDELAEIAGRWRFDTDRVVEAGDRVVWTGRVFGDAVGEAPPYEARSGVIFTYRDGRVARLHWFADPEQALRAAGLGP